MGYVISSQLESSEWIYVPHKYFAPIKSDKSYVSINVTTSFSTV